VRYVARKGEGRDTYRMLVGRPEGKNHFQDLGVDGRIILKWIFKRLDEEFCTGFIWFGLGRGGWRF